MQHPVLDFLAGRRASRSNPAVTQTSVAGITIEEEDGEPRRISVLLGGSRRIEILRAWIGAPDGVIEVARNEGLMTPRATGGGPMAMLRAVPFDDIDLKVAVIRAIGHVERRARELGATSVCAIVPISTQGGARTGQYDGFWSTRGFRLDARGVQGAARYIKELSPA